MQGARKGTQGLGVADSTTVNRLDLGVKWNRAVEDGGMTRGDDVRIDIAIEAVHQSRRS
ncbi:MAG TPA: hypothetical protein VH539_13995 [Gemmatimonadaceae bacterium]